MSDNNSIKVITTVAAWPEALPVMKELLKRHLNEPFEFIVFVDTPAKPGPYNLWDKELRRKAYETAEDLADRAYLVPEEIHKDRRILFPYTIEKSGKNANTRAADTLQYAWCQEIQSSNVPVFVIDNDMFPVRDFSVKEILAGSVLAGVYSQSPSKNLAKIIPWIWAGLLFLDPSRMEHKEKWSFDCGRVDGVPVDVSGQTYHWLQAALLEGIEPNWINHLSSLQWALDELPISLPKEITSFMQQDDRNIDNKLYCELYRETFLHFRAGSNWNRETAEKVSYRNDKFLKAVLEC
jgi:hypothetical protein